ncbi:MAG: BlaI/MecI/CopY family transcriptional regulator [Firmicutes bacterium]|nr:BlaI/MecI/CopY family transcriptional regulator [Bacillota bacterium]
MRQNTQDARAGRLFDSELRVLQVLWQHGDMPARDIAAILGEQVGWGKTTTYTVIKKCLDKGVVQRIEPNFVCRALLTQEQAGRQEAGALIDRLYQGRADRLVAALLGGDRLSADEIAGLRRLIEELPDDAAVE